jgi:SAM-dependent methyltransferase
MRSPETWTESKFVYRRGRLAASPDAKQVWVASRLAADVIAQAYDALLPLHARGRLLDLGCGRVPLYRAYRPLVDDNVCVDWANSLHRNPHIDHEADLTQPLPFGAAEFDTVLLSDVLEHVPVPDELVAEIARVLRPGGTLILNVPFFYWLHEQPHDYCRYTEFALRRFAQRAGLEVVHLEPAGGAAEIVADIVSKNLARLPRIGPALAAATQWAAMRWMRTRAGRSFARRSGREFPFGYFMVARRPATTA